MQYETDKIFFDKKGKVIGFEVLNYLSLNDIKDLRKLPVGTEILA